MLSGWNSLACPMLRWIGKSPAVRPAKGSGWRLLRTLMQAPAAVLLLDEPTGNLDQDSTRRVEVLARRLSSAAVGQRCSGSVTTRRRSERVAQAQLPPATTAGSHGLAAMNVIALSPLDLAVAALLIVALGGLSLRMHIGVERQLLVSAARSTIQLFLIGLVLKVLFESAQPVWVALLTTVMLVVAGREVMVRQKRRFVGCWGFGVGTLSMFVSAFAVTVMALLLVIGTDPWYAPQYAIPLLGMVLGNTMNGICARDLTG
jgi:hypothetical protein